MWELEGNMDGGGEVILKLDLRNLEKDSLKNLEIAHCQYPLMNTSFSAFLLSLFPLSLPDTPWNDLPKKTT